MNSAAGELEFQRFWCALQQMGLNAYEARTYLVLVGHAGFEALKLAPGCSPPVNSISPFPLTSRESDSALSTN